MPTDVSGTTHYAYDRLVLEGTSGERLPSTAITVRSIAGDVLTPLDPVALSEITPFQSNPEGVTPSCLLPATKVTYDAGAGAFTVTSDDVADLAQSAADAAAAAEAVLATVGEVETITGAQEKADAAELQAKVYVDQQVLDVARFAGSTVGRFWLRTSSETLPTAADGATDGDVCFKG
jgi:hypothetical protein